MACGQVMELVDMPGSNPGGLIARAGSRPVLATPASATLGLRKCWFGATRKIARKEPAMPAKVTVVHKWARVRNQGRPGVEVIDTNGVVRR